MKLTSGLELTLPTDVLSTRALSIPRMLRRESGGPSRLRVNKTPHSKADDRVRQLSAIWLTIHK
jgi:hypothetical protein